MKRFIFLIITALILSSCGISYVATDDYYDRHVTYYYYGGHYYRYYPPIYYDWGFRHVHPIGPHHHNHPHDIWHGNGPKPNGPRPDANNGPKPGYNNGKAPYGGHRAVPGGNNNGGQQKSNVSGGSVRSGGTHYSPSGGRTARSGGNSSAHRSYSRGRR